LPANSASLAAEAYTVVRRRIVRGEMAIGQSVSRRKLAAELGMSFLPVSEALLRLEFEGMLESRPRAGTRVRIPTREDVKGQYLVREILESEAARRFAMHATTAERASLMKMAAKVDALSAKKERGPYLALHHRLHSRIAECARCDALSAVIEQTCALSSTWFCLLTRAAGGPPTHRHRDLARAMTTLKPDEAAAVMREHVRYSEREALDRLKPYFRIKRDHGRTFFRSERARQRRMRTPLADGAAGVTS
jgi:DNA-binding GntR family transcriptional regulator